MPDSIGSNGACKCALNAYTPFLVKKITGKKARHSKTVTVNLTCPVLLYENGQLEWKRRGYTGPSDVFQSALRKMTGMDFTLDG